MIEPRYALASLVSVAVWLSPRSGETSLLVNVFTTPPATVCIEDMPCWDCATMGNRICGPDYETETGEYVAGYN